MTHVVDSSQPLLHNVGPPNMGGRMSDECVWGQDIFPAAFCPQSPSTWPHHRPPFQEIVILLVGDLEVFQPISPSPCPDQRLKCRQIMVVKRRTRTECNALTGF